MNAGFAATVVCVLFTAACAPAAAPASSDAPALLPNSVVLDLSTARRFFPAVTHLAHTGADTTAQGEPAATRGVFYENASGSKRVTISVDRYGGAAQAASAYATALAKSEEVRGFKLLHGPELAQRTFAGTVTMNGETHVGIGVLSGNLIVGATLAGFDASDATISNLVSMTRAEIAHVGNRVSN
jgi:hypothetical protein